MTDSPSILMVDDDLVTNFIVERKLKQVGIEADLHFVENGREAFEWIDNNKVPRIILLDISMPVMNGYDFLSEWVSRGYKGKSFIWILTASMNDQVKERLEEFDDIEGFFEKPLNQMNIDIMISKLKSKSES